MESFFIGSCLVLALACAVVGFLVRRIVRLEREVYRESRDPGSAPKGEDFFRSLVQNASDLIVVVGADGNIRYASGSAQRALGRRPEDLVGTSMARLAHPDDARRVEGLLAECLSDPSVDPCIDFRFQRGSGHWSHVEAVARNRLDDESVDGLVVTLRDITRRKWAEEALRAAETKYRALVQHLPLVTYVDNLDEHSSAVYMSEQIEPILGYSTQEWLDDPELFAKLLHQDDRERVMTEVARTHETGRPFVCDYRLVARDGRVVWFHDEAIHILDETGRPLYAQGYMLDITAQKTGDGAGRTRGDDRRSLGAAAS